MNKLFTKIAGLFLGLTMAVGVGVAAISNNNDTLGVNAATDPLVYTLTPAKGTNNGYAGSCDIAIDGITWNLTGNSTMIPWRIGGKNLTNVDRALYSKTQISSSISQIDVLFGTNSGITVNSFKLIYSLNADFSNATTVLSKFTASSTVSITGDFPAKSYYKFVWNFTAGGDNEYIQFSEAKFYGTTETEPDVPEQPGTGGNESDYEETIDFNGQTFGKLSYGIDEYKNVLVVAKNSTNYLAMSNNNGTGSAPKATKLDAATGTSVDYLWDVIFDSGKYTFYPSGTTATWLYCTNSNNGVRVGTNSNKTFTLDSSGYFKHDGTSRYLGVYNNQDWRCYGSPTATNIKNQTFGFYQLISGGEPAKVIDKVEISGSLTRTEYTTGQAWDLAGLQLKIIYSSDHENEYIELTADGVKYTLTPAIPTIGQNLTISGTYNDNYTFTDSFDVSVSAAEIPDSDEATITFDDVSKRISFTPEQQIWFENGITVVNEKGESITAVGDYFDPVRFYANSTVTISTNSEIYSISFSTVSDAYATALKNSIGDQADISLNDSKVVIVTLDGTTNSSSFTVGEKIHLNSITVYYTSEGGGIDTSIKPSKISITHQDGFVIGQTYFENFTQEKYVMELLDEEDNSISIITPTTKGLTLTIKETKDEPAVTLDETTVVLKEHDGRDICVTYDDGVNEPVEYKGGAGFNIETVSGFSITSISQSKETFTFGETDCFVTFAYETVWTELTASNVSASSNNEDIYSVSTITMLGNAVRCDLKLNAPGGTVINFAISLPNGETYSCTSQLVIVYAATSEGTTTTTKTFEKVTTAPTDWTGTYLIVYETGKLAFDGSLATLDASKNFVSVNSISNNQIAYSDDLSSSTFTISAYNGGYSILSASGKYINNASNSNALSANNSAGKNTLSLNNDATVNIVGSGGSYLRYNSNSDQQRFRYFKSSTYGSQKAICLYKLVEKTVSTGGTVDQDFIDAANFVKTWMRPEINVTDNSNGDYCTTNWNDIVNAYNGLTPKAKTYIQENFVEMHARLAWWAQVNGSVLNTANNGQNSIVPFGNKLLDTNIVTESSIVIVFVCIGVLALASFVIIKRRRENQ